MGKCPKQKWPTHTALISVPLTAAFKFGLRSFGYLFAFFVVFALCPCSLSLSRVGDENKLTPHASGHGDRTRFGPAADVWQFVRPMAKHDVQAHVEFPPPLFVFRASLRCSRHHIQSRARLVLRSLGLAPVLVPLGHVIPRQRHLGLYEPEPLARSGRDARRRQSVHHGLHRQRPSGLAPVRWHLRACKGNGSYRLDRLCVHPFPPSPFRRRSATDTKRAAWQSASFSSCSLA